MSDPTPAVSIDTFNVLSASVSDLGSLVKMMLQKMDVSKGTAAPTTVLAAHIPEFVPPITAVTANGMSIIAPTSICAYFPDIEAAVIVAIVTHDFKASDLHKLNPENCNREVAYAFNGSTNQFEISNKAVKECKSPFSVLVPLQRFFNVLSFHLSKSDTIPFVFYKYTAHLIELTMEYE